MRLLLLFCLCILLTNCRNADEFTEEKSIDSKMTLSIKSAELTNELKSTYETFLSKRKDWLPDKMVLEKGKLNPVDEARIDTAFFVFRQKLIQAIEDKDVFYLLDKTAEDVKYSFGAENGIAGFVEMWHLDSPEGIKSSSIWATLKSVLENGGTFRNNRQSFAAPYYYAAFPDQFDAFTYGVVVGRGVRMRKTASLSAPVVKSLSYEILEIKGKTTVFESINAETYPWIQVKLPDGKEGYVWGKFIGSPVDYRAGFTRQENGDWQMDFFLAGD